MVPIDLHEWPIDPEDIRKEKQKARELRQTQWWKNRRAHNRCYFCQKPFPAQTLTMDHLVPLSRGGKTTKSNVVPCCKDCNTRKKHLLPVEWDAYLEQLKKAPLA